MSDRGILCVDCFRKWENEERANRDSLDREEARALVTAARLGWLHGTNWMVAVILLAAWGQVPAWLSSFLLGSVFVAAFAMRLRSRPAFYAAMAIDSIGAVAFAIVAAAQVRDGRLGVLLFPVLFGGWLGWLTWRERAVFASRPRL